MKSLGSPVTKLSMAVRNAENGVVGVVRGHSRLMAMSPFDRAHTTTTSYSTLIETMRLSCTVFEITASYLSKVADFDPPHLHSAPS